MDVASSSSCRNIASMKRIATPSNHSLWNIWGLNLSLSVMLGCLSIVSSASAEEELSLCTNISNDQERLRCYDRQVERLNQHESTEDPMSDAHLADNYLDQAWEISANKKRPSFSFREYRTNYLFPLRYSSNPNSTPQTPTHPNTTSSPIQRNEFRFQLSFKTKLKEHLLGTKAYAWFAYTQQSNWQFYNTSQSSPFRETNYEPELILSIPSTISVLGAKLALINLGLVHQSNGNAGVYSRSWNRLYAQANFTQGNLLLSTRAWWRLPESIHNNDNPDIRRYMGSGDLRATWFTEGHRLSALTRYSFQGKKGAVQINWTFPINGHLKGYAELFSGYGESLIDYNHFQNIIAAGLLLSTWH